MARLVRIPAPVDPHVHLRGLEWSHKGTFSSETRAAVAGGYWAVLDMPNTTPPALDRVALNRKLTELSALALCDWGVYFGASAKGNWDEYTDTSRDVCGLKMFCNDTTGHLLIEDQAIRDRHFSAWPTGKIIAVHAEEDTVLDILALVRKYRKPTHFLHISTAREIGYLRQAKADGLPVTIGVCPHHLWLTQDDLGKFGSLGMMKPGLKTVADCASLWKAIEDGVVDVVESDHAPHTLEEKASDKPPFGVPGLETTLPLLFTAVCEGRLPVERAIDLVATNPRQIWGISAPPDTFAIIDIDATYIIDRAQLHTLCGWSPFEGMRVHGKVVETWIRGRKVYDGEQVLAEPGYGKQLYG